jgi:DNA repair exonuclease SbcCD ATPase subunit
MSERKLRLLEERTYNDAAAEMLKDTGIKTKIVKEYLPVMNNLVNKYLQVLDFFVSFHLDENFNEVIKSRHRDNFNYASFSEGEKQRIDLALLFTWRQIARMKNSTSTNLLVLDETFDSSLDQDGVDNLMKILGTLENDTNVFVISHKGDLLDGKFRSKIVFEKEHNFSVMAAER